MSCLSRRTFVPFFGPFAVPFVTLLNGHPQAEEVQEHTVAGGQDCVLLAEGGGRQRQADAEGVECGHAGRVAAPAAPGGDGTVRLVRRILAPKDTLLQLKTAEKGTCIYDVRIGG